MFTIIAAIGIPMFTELAHNIAGVRNSADAAVSPDEAFEAAVIKLISSRIARDPKSRAVILPVAPTDRKLLGSLVTLGWDRDTSPYYMTQYYTEVPGYKTLHFYKAGVEMLKAKGVNINGLAEPGRSV